MNISHSFPSEFFSLPLHYRDSVGDVLIPHGMILDRIEALAQTIVQNSPDPLVICPVLTGAHQFASDLSTSIKKQRRKDGSSVPIFFEYLRASSYLNDQSTGTVQLSISDKQKQFLANKHLLVVEDIVDTGHTLTHLIAALKALQPASIRVVSLLLKKTDRSNGYVPDYVGFIIPDAFVVGYALDYNEHFRDMDHICIINDHGKVKYAA